MPSNSEILQTAIQAARAGGDIVAKYFETRTDGDNSLQASIKTIDRENQGLVTRADVESEQAIVALIRKIFPDHRFLGEESFDADTSSENLWIIDPLDGTNNFAHGIPHFAISVAYYQNGTARCGAILNPVSGDLFACERGQGAWHGERRVHVNTHAQLTDTMIAVGFYYDRGEMMRSTLASIEQLFEQNVHGIRRMGTASLDLVQVGLGRFGGYFEYTLSPWDFAAARVFVEEAGGRVTTCSGDELKLEKSSVLASNGLLHNAILEIVSRNRPTVN